MTRTKEQIVADLAYLVAEKRKQVCNASFPRFVDVYLKSLSTSKRPVFHEEMMTLMEQMTDLHRLLFIAPRGFAKSTLCSVFFVLWLSLFQKKKDIFIVSATISLSRELLRKIRNEIENNPYILNDFGELKSSKWTEEQLELNNGTVIRAKGRGFQIRGFRPDFIVCDDLEDEEVIYSKDQRDKLEQWFFRTLIPALKPDQDLLYVGTMLHQFSLIKKLREKPQFTTRYYKALIANPQSSTGELMSIWEEYWPAVKLIELRTQMGTYAFEAEYQNNPLSLEEQPIKPHMLEGVRITGTLDLTCLAVDPAISEKNSSDYRAITVFGRYRDKETNKITGFKELYSVRGRWGIEEFINRIIDTYIQHRPERVIIEAVAFQKVLRPLIIARSRERDIFMPVSEAELGIGNNKRPKDKYTRLMGVVHLFEQRLVELDNPELIEEALAFPHGEYDDMVDSMVFGLAWLAQFRHGASFAKAQPRGAVAVKATDSFYVKEVRPGVFMAQVDAVLPPPRTNKLFINYDRSSRNI